MKKMKVLFSGCFLIIMFFTISAFAQDSNTPCENLGNVGFGGEKFESDKRLLESFAECMKYDSELFIYIIIYSEKRYKSKAFDRLEKTRNYLIENLQISAERIDTTDADNLGPGIKMKIFLYKVDILSDNIEDGWKNIKPLQTKKSDIKKILGEPTVDENNNYSYKVPEGSIQIIFTSPCKEDPKKHDKFIKDENTVLEYTLFLTGKFQLSKLKFNLNNFIREVSDTSKNAIVYRNNYKGIEISVYKENDEEFVSKIIFKPGKNIENCRNTFSGISFF